jgi:hypothetical protein
VWSSLIAVTLLSLSIGYYLGGRLADARRLDLSTVLLLAGIATAAVPLLRVPVLRLTNPLGLRLGSLASAVLLFGFPITALATIGPGVVKRLAIDPNRVGRVSGVVLTASTVGSVLGTLSLGFFLLPMLGTRVILWGVAATLVGTALLLRWDWGGRTDRGRPGAGGFVPLLLGGSFVAWAGVASGSSNPQVVFEADGLQGTVRVIDDDQRGVRWLLSDASTVGAIRLERKEPVFPYLSFFEALPHFVPSARSALVIGLGAGYLPDAYQRHSIATDAIEIDPAIRDAAFRYFPYQRPRRTIMGDARREVARLDQRYDIIVHDCFTGGSVPAHLLSVEMLRDVRAHLTEGGLFAMNFFGYSKRDGATALQAVRRTVAAVFPHQRVFVSSPGHDPIDNLILASSRPITLTEHEGACSLSGVARFMLDDLSARENTDPLGEGFLVTDDFNPLDYLQTGKAEEYRNIIAQRLGLDLLAL